MPLTRIKTTAIDHVFLSEFLGTVASESAMLALVGGIGDYAVRSDLNNDSFIITQNNGSSIGDWQKISNTSTALLKSENLNDLPDAGTARSNLGLGTAATTAATDYATAAQGTKADSALQPTNNLNDLNDAGTALDNLGFSAFGKSIIDDADAAAVRTTLGLGEAATSNTLAGTNDFTATGALANGDIVGLRSDGTVEKVADGTVLVPDSASASMTNLSITARSPAMVYDSYNNAVVIAYRDMNNNSYGTAVVGTVSGTSITFGTPVTFWSEFTEYTSITFDSSNNKVVITFQGYTGSGGGYGCYAVVGTVSGNSISFGSAAGFTPNTVGTRIEYTKSVFDSYNNKVVIAFRYTTDVSNWSGYACVGTVSGTSISFGSITGFSGDTQQISLAFDSFNNKAVIAYRDGNIGRARVGTVSGTSISFGTAVTYLNDVQYGVAITFDSNSNKIAILYAQYAYDPNSGTFLPADGMHGIVGTVSGTSISFGSATQIIGAPRSSSVKMAATFDSYTNKVVFIYEGYGVVAEISGTSISFETPISISGNQKFPSADFDSNTNQVVISNGEDSLYAGIFTVANYTNNADTWIGIADGTSGTVKIMGGVAEGLTGLTTGTIYYVNYDGTLTATENAGPENGTYGKIGRAISSTQLFITEGNA
jgi:hypothetical protein